MTSEPTPNGRRRGRPRSVERTSDLEPREEILRAASSRFSSAGVGATKMAEIAADVGLSAPAVYHWFPNRDAIVEALLEYVVDESAAFATAAVSRAGSPSERLHALVHQHLDRLTSGPYDLWFVAGMSEQDSRRFETVGRKATQWRRAVVKLVEEGIDLGELAPIDPRMAVAAVSGLVYGALQLRHERGEVDASVVANLAVAALRTERGRA